MRRKQRLAAEVGLDKRDLQKRPTKETYKRDLQKRPTKETYKRVYLEEAAPGS